MTTGELNWPYYLLKFECDLVISGRTILERKCASTEVLCGSSAKETHSDCMGGREAQGSTVRLLSIFP